jgi:hypothetical protein
MINVQQSQVVNLPLGIKSTLGPRQRPTPDSTDLLYVFVDLVLVVVHPIYPCPFSSVRKQSRLSITLYRSSLPDLLTYFQSVQSLKPASPDVPAAWLANQPRPGSPAHPESSSPGRAPAQSAGAEPGAKRR